MLPCHFSILRHCGQLIQLEFRTHTQRECNHSSHGAALSSHLLAPLRLLGFTAAPFRAPSSYERAVKSAARW